MNVLELGGITQCRIRVLHCVQSNDGKETPTISRGSPRIIPLDTVDKKNHYIYELFQGTIPRLPGGITLLYFADRSVIRR